MRYQLSSMLVLGEPGGESPPGHSTIPDGLIASRRAWARAQSRVCCTLGSAELAQSRLEQIAADRQTPTEVLAILRAHRCVMQASAVHLPASNRPGNCV